MYPNPSPALILLSENIPIAQETAWLNDVLQEVHIFKIVLKWGER